MTLRKRINRLEGATVKPVHGLCAITREIMQPSACGPELVAVMKCPLYGGDAARIDRSPGEGEAAFRARFAGMQAA